MALGTLWMIDLVLAAASIVVLVVLLYLYRANFRTLRSPLSLGLLASGRWGTFTDEQAMDLLRKAYDAGINYFDVAPTDGNGRGERLLGETFKDRRELVIISSKVGRAEGRPDFSPASIRASLEKTLDRLASSYVDVLPLHYPDAA